MKRALREKTLFPIDIRKKGADSRWAFFASRAIKTAMRKRDLLSVTTQLAIMTKSGVDLASAFESLAESDAATERVRKVLGRIHEDVTGGKSISDAMRAQADVFGDAYVASVAAGEAAGQLPEVLGRLAELQRTEIRNRATIRTLLAYPILLATISSLVVIGPGASSCCRSSQKSSSNSKCRCRRSRRCSWRVSDVLRTLHLDLGAARCWLRSSA